MWFHSCKLVLDVESELASGVHASLLRILCLKPRPTHKLNAVAV